MKMLPDESESRTRQTKLNVEAIDGVVRRDNHEVNGGRSGRWWVKAGRTNEDEDAGGR